MTDIQALIKYRLNQAEETLSEAQRMLNEKFSVRTIINRAYYSMFYGLLALFLATGIRLRTSKHSGLISIFDKEFVHTGKIEKEYSRILHRMFEIRQESDYKEFVKFNEEDAIQSVNFAKQFLDRIKELISKISINA